MAEHWLRRIQPDLVFDVGANQGQYGQWLRNNGYQGRIISFEPDPDAFAILARNAATDKRWICHNTAIGTQTGDVEFFVTGDASPTSSILEPLSHGYAAITSRRIVPINRLEEYIEPYKSTFEKMWLKSDTQGYDLEVLRSAGHLISEIRCIQVECSIISNYAGQPYVYQIMEYCQEKDFYLSDLILGMMKNGQLVECDLILTQLDGSIHPRL